MKPALQHPQDTKPDWRETLLIAVELGLLSPFNIEWLIDKAETEEWNALWW